MRDYSNIPKMDWKENKGTLARIKNQISHEEPVILLMPPNYNFEFYAEEACQYDLKSDIFYDCTPNSVLSSLAQQNSDATLEQVGAIADEAGLILDVDSLHRQLIIHD